MADTTMADTDPRNLAALDSFFAAAQRALDEGRFEQLLLAGPLAAAGDLQRLTARAIVIKGERRLQLVFRHARRDETQHLALDEGLAALRALVGTSFANAHLLTRDEELQLAFSRKGRYSLRRARRVEPAEEAPADADASAAGAHDRAKRRPIPIDRPFLVELGVTDAQHRLVPAMARKWKQINRFVEIVGGAIADSPLAGRERIDVLDFGAGRGYLTFALHDHLARAAGPSPSVTGVEHNADLVVRGNAIVERLGLQGLRFEQGDIMGFAPRPVDVMIALHACDTLTDHAIHYAIRGGATIVCCAPCCHKQLRPQLRVPQPLGALLKHGVHLGQEAEMLTDALRALLLQACGYDAQVFEFVSLEHTAKNKMILAVRRGERRREEALRQALDLEAFFGIREQCLRELLEAEGCLPRREVAA